MRETFLSIIDFSTKIATVESVVLTPVFHRPAAGPMHLRSAQVTTTSVASAVVAAEEITSLTAIQSMWYVERR